MLFKYLFLLLPLYISAASYAEPWGKDSDILARNTKESPSFKEESTAVFMAKKVILFHQRVISPVDGPRSHFFPCSSKYMKDAMLKHGFITGFLMGCDRLLRENKDPWIYRNVVIDGKLVKYDPPR